MNVSNFIDPVIFKIGFFELRWYSVAYIFGFVGAYIISRYLNRFCKKSQVIPLEKLDYLLNYCFFGVILGGRMGFVIFYEPHYFLLNPLEIFAIWNGGMSFHGGLLGVILGIVAFSKVYKFNMWHIFDRASICILPGIFFGRIANFINGELWGKHTNSNYGVLFQGSGDFLNRHPSQLYEALCEGLIPFIVLFTLLKFTKLFQKNGVFAAIFLTLYSVSRFFIEEFFREPHGIFKIFGIIFSTGQLLCIAMFVLGNAMIWKANKGFAKL